MPPAILSGPPAHLLLPRHLGQAQLSAANWSRPPIAACAVYGRRMTVPRGKEAQVSGGWRPGVRRERPTQTVMARAQSDATTHENRLDMHDLPPMSSAQTKVAVLHRVPVRVYRIGGSTSNKTVVDGEGAWPTEPF